MAEREREKILVKKKLPTNFLRPNVISFTRINRHYLNCVRCLASAVAFHQQAAARKARIRLYEFSLAPLSFNKTIKSGGNEKEIYFYLYAAFYFYVQCNGFSRRNQLLLFIDKNKSILFL